MTKLWLSECVAKWLAATCSNCHQNTKMTSGLSSCTFVNQKNLAKPNFDQWSKEDAVHVDLIVIFVYAGIKYEA